MADDEDVDDDPEDDVEMDEAVEEGLVLFPLLLPLLDVGIGPSLSSLDSKSSCWCSMPMVEDLCRIIIIGQRKFQKKPLHTTSQNVTFEFLFLEALSLVSKFPQIPSLLCD